MPAVGASRIVLRGDGSLLSAEVLEVDAGDGEREARYYVHYLAHDRRLDEWIVGSQFQGAAGDATGGGGARKRLKDGGAGAGAHSAAMGMGGHGRRGHETDPTVAERLELAREQITRVKNVVAVVFSGWRVEPWYVARVQRERRRERFFL